MHNDPIKPDNDEDADIAAFLRDRGHTELEVQKIMLRIKHYEEHMQVASVMSSIGDGTLDLASIIAEALAGDAPA